MLIYSQALLKQDISCFFLDGLSSSHYPPDCIGYYPFTTSPADQVSGCLVATQLVSEQMLMTTLLSDIYAPSLNLIYGVTHVMIVSCPSLAFAFMLLLISHAIIADFASLYCILFLQFSLQSLHPLTL